MVVDRCGKGCVWRQKVILTQRRVERSEEEQAIMLAFDGNVTSQLKASVIGWKGKNFPALEAWAGERTKVVSVIESRGSPSRSHIGCKRAMELRATGLSDDLEDAAIYATILWFVGGGFHLDFLDEGEIDTCAQRSIDRAEYTEAAVAGVVEHDAIHQVEILKTSRAPDGGVRVARATAIDDSRCHIEERSNIAGNRNLLIELGRQVGAYRGRARIDADGGGIHLNRLSNIASRERKVHALGLVDDDFEVLRGLTLKAGLLHLNGVHSWSEVRRNESAGSVSGDDAMVGGAADGDFRIGNDGSRLICDDAAQATACCGKLLAIETARYANACCDRKSGQQEAFPPELMHTRPPKENSIVASG